MEIDATLLDSVKRKLGTGSINIFGLPFSGKDTHGHNLSRYLEGPLIGGGDILRNSNLDELKKHIATGLLAPSDEYLAIVTPYLAKDEFAGKPLILSSVGRWYGEHEGILSAAETAQHPIKAVVLLTITPEEAIRRWNLADRDRHDDQGKHILETRFAEFFDKTMPVIEYYREKGLLIEVDGMPPKDEVTLAMLHAIDQKIS